MNVNTCFLPHRSHCMPCLLQHMARTWQVGAPNRVLRKRRSRLPATPGVKSQHKTSLIVIISMLEESLTTWLPFVWLIPHCLAAILQGSTSDAWHPEQNGHMHPFQNNQHVSCQRTEVLLASSMYQRITQMPLFNQKSAWQNTTSLPVAAVAPTRCNARPVAAKHV